MAFERLRASLELDTSGFQSGVNDAQEELSGLGESASDTGRSMQRAGGALTAGVTAPLSAMAGASASAAAGFDQSMQESIAVMGDVDDAMREDLEDTARDVATSMSVSHDEAAESFYFLASAGLDAAESQEAMADVAAFAEAGQMDMAAATDTATNVMSAFGFEADEMTKVTDTLTGVVTNHNQTMEGMSSAMSRVAPTAAGLGADIEEVSAAIGGLGDVGLDGERAGTALNTVLSQMADESGPAAQGMEEMGVSVTDSEGQMRPLVDILSDFEDAGADAGDMAELFGTRGGPAMSALLEQGSDALEENTANLEDMDGVTEEVAETQRDTLNAQLDILRSNIRDAGITIGANLLPPLNNLIARLQPAAEWFQDLSERQQQLIIGTAALAASIGPLLLGLGTLLTLLPTITAGVGALGAGLAVLTGPIGLAVVAIGALAAAFATDFMGIRTMTQESVAAILEYLDPIITVLRDEFIETLEVWADTFQMVLGYVADLWDEHGDTVMKIVDPFIEGLKTAFKLFKTTVIFYFETLFDVLVTAVRVGLAILRGDFEGAFEIIGDFLERQVDRFGDFGKSLMKTFTEGIRNAASAPVDAVRNMAEEVRAYLPFSPAEAGALSDIDKSGESLSHTVADGIEDEGDAIEQALDEAAEDGIDSYESSIDAGNTPETAAASTDRSASAGGLSKEDLASAFAEAIQELGVKVEVKGDEQGLIEVVDAKLDQRDKSQRNLARETNARGGPI